MNTDLHIDFTGWGDIRSKIYGDLLPDPAIIWEIVSEGTSELEIGGVTIPFADTISDEEAYVLWSIFSALPPPLLSYIFNDKSVAVLPHENFREMRDEFLAHASPSMGANFTEDSFVVDYNLLLDPERARKSNIAIWYALSAIVAQDLDDIEEFDSSRFQAQFVRYLREKAGETTEVDPEIREFFDVLFEAEFLNRSVIRDLYAEKMHVNLPRYQPVLDTHLPMTWSMPSVFRSNFLTQIQEQGFTLDLGNSVAMSLGMVNAKERERPESSHELRVLFYSRALNEIVSSFLSAGDWRPAALISAGIMATYQTQRPESSKYGRVFLGAGFDLGLDPQSGLILHSYFGVPVFVSSQGVEENSWLPYWEAGIVRLGSGDSLFIGLSASSSFIDSSSQYYGLVVRYENF